MPTTMRSTPAPRRPASLARALLRVGPTAATAWEASVARTEAQRASARRQGQRAWIRAQVDRRDLGAQEAWTPCHLQGGMHPLAVARARARLDAELMERVSARCR